MATPRSASRRYDPASSLGVLAMRLSSQGRPLRSQRTDYRKFVGLQKKGTPRHNSTSAACTTKAKGCRRTTPRPPAGIAKPPSRDTLTPSTTSASCTTKGQGVPQDYAEAVRWYRKAADQGHAGAQFNLGVMYDKAEGCRRTTPRLSLVSQSRRAGRRRRSVQPRLHVPRRPRGAAGLRRGRPLVPQSRRPGARCAPSSTSASCTTRAKGCRRTTPRPSAGTAKPPTRGTPTPSSTSASCTTAAKGCRRTTPRPSAGTAKPPSRGTRGPVQPRRHVRRGPRGAAGLRRGRALVPQSRRPGRRQRPVQPRPHVCHEGQGVPQDYAEAVRWYRKAAEQGDAERPVQPRRHV